MKTSERLTIAKSYLAKNQADLDAGKTRYVCLATNRFDSSPKIRMLLLRIDKSMRGTFAVPGWLCINGHATVEQLSNTTATQEYRHRWLDSLIQEYKEKGD
jgi:hypothetical protein